MDDFFKMMLFSGAFSGDNNKPDHSGVDGNYSTKYGSLYSGDDLSAEDNSDTEKFGSHYENDDEDCEDELGED